MRKIYHLSSCSTCQRIINELSLEENDFEFQDIKENNIEPEMLDKLKEQEGSYEALFSKRAMKYRSMGLNEMDLNDKDYKNHILEEYTFLKRPVIVIDDKYFIGNSKKVVEAAKNSI